MRIKKALLFFKLSLFITASASLIISCSVTPKAMENRNGFRKSFRIDKFYSEDRLFLFKDESEHIRSTIGIGTYFYSPEIDTEVIEDINLKKSNGSLEAETTVWSYRQMCIIYYDKYNSVFPISYECVSPKYLILI